MAIQQQHELHARRGGRNRALGLVLGGFVLLVFGVTIVKLSSGQSMEAFDHTVRPSITVSDK